MNKRFPQILQRALKVGEAAAKLAQERRRAVAPEDAIGCAVVFLSPDDPFTEWALQNQHAGIGFERFPLLDFEPPQGVTADRPEICGAQAEAIARALTNEGVTGARASFYIQDITNEDDHEADYY